MPMPAIPVDRIPIQATYPAIPDAIVAEEIAAEAVAAEATDTPK